MRKNHVKNRGGDVHVEKPVDIDYAAILEKLAHVFGRAHVSPFVFPDSAPAPTDLVSAFCQAAKLRVDLSNAPIPKRRNTSLDVRALEILTEVNKIVPTQEDGKVSPQREAIEAALAETFTENAVGYRMSRAEAETILAAHSQSNARVARDWFGRDALFNDDMSVYDRPLPEAGPDDYARVIARLADMVAEQKTSTRSD